MLGNEVYLIVGLFTAADSVETSFIAFVTEVLKEEWGFDDSAKATTEAAVASHPWGRVHGSSEPSCSNLRLHCLCGFHSQREGLPLTRICLVFCTCGSVGDLILPPRFSVCSCCCSVFCLSVFLSSSFSHSGRRLKPTVFLWRTRFFAGRGGARGASLGGPSWG